MLKDYVTWKAFGPWCDAMSFRAADRLVPEITSYNSLVEFSSVLRKPLFRLEFL